MDIVWDDFFHSLAFKENKNTNYIMESHKYFRVIIIKLINNKQIK